ncbi:MAG: sulfate/molybdate ABC transporter ATP-binding protein [Caulobacteraceae bacterium]
MALVIERLCKRFGRVAVLMDVGLRVAEGEFLAVLGPSGAGKTTLLRILAGLDTPDAGRVTLDGEDFLALSARERRVGMVFQHYALFRHLSAARNIAFGLAVRPRGRRPSRGEIDSRVGALLSLTRIEALGGRYPSQLSGGERQLVALARALAVEPRLLLLDEPFGALDAKVRASLRDEVRRVHDATGVTTLLVTHDRDEAMGLADRVAVMDRGRIVQVGTAEALEAAPASPFVFEFLGETNRAPCEARDGRLCFDGFETPAIGTATSSGRGVGLFRPSDTNLAAGDTGPGMAVRVTGVFRRGAILRVECEGPGALRLAAEMSDGPAARFIPGEAARLTARRAMVDFDALDAPTHDEELIRARRA